MPPNEVRGRYNKGNKRKPEKQKWKDKTKGGKYNACMWNNGSLARSQRNRRLCLQIKLSKIQINK